MCRLTKEKSNQYKQNICDSAHSFYDGLIDEETYTDELFNNLNNMNGFRRHMSNEGKKSITTVLVKETPSFIEGSVSLSDIDKKIFEAVKEHAWSVITKFANALAPKKYPFIWDGILRNLFGYYGKYYDKFVQKGIEYCQTHRIDKWIGTRELDSELWEFGKKKIRGFL